MADALANWLPDIFPAATPFVSTAIEAGLNWFNEIESKLQEARFGIVCLTLDSYKNPWVNFEAGALQTAFKGNRVCPYYLDGQTTDYQPPLGLLHMMKADRDGTLGLIRSISSVLTENNLPTHDSARLAKHFETWWEALENQLNAIPPTPNGVTSTETRPVEDMVREVLEIVRTQAQGNIPDVNSDTRDSLFYAAAQEANEQLKAGNIDQKDAAKRALAIYDISETNDNVIRVMLEMLEIRRNAAMRRRP